MPRIFLLMMLICEVSQATSHTLSGTYDSDLKMFTPLDGSYTCDFFEQGVARIYHRGRVGLIDSTGRLLLPVKYDRISDFESEVATACVKGQCELVDRKGNFIAFADPKKILEQSTYTVSDINVVSCKSLAEKSFKSALSKGTTAIGAQFRNCPVFNDYRIALKKNKWGIIDSAARPVTPFIYDAIVPLNSTTMLLVRYEGSCSLNTGTPRYVYKGRYRYWYRDGRYSKERSFSKVIQGIADFHRADLVAGSPTRFAPYAVDGQFTCAPRRQPNSLEPKVEYALEEIVFEGFRIVSYDREKEQDETKPLDFFTGRFERGLMDGEGKLRIPADFDQILTDGSPRLIVIKSTKSNESGEMSPYYGVMDVQGRVIIPLGNYTISQFPNAYLLRRETKPEVWESAIYDLTGKEIIPFSKRDYRANEFGQWTVDDGAKIIER